MQDGEAGLPRAVHARDNADALAAGDAGPAGPAPAPNAADLRQSGQRKQARPGAREPGHREPAPGSKPGKRRKRKRGRKVFARDGLAGGHMAGPAVSPAMQETRQLGSVSIALGRPALRAFAGSGPASVGSVEPTASAAGAMLSSAASAMPSGRPDGTPGELAPSGRTLPPRQSPGLPLFAALDLGTNNCRLLVAVPGRPGQFRVVDAFSRIVRLGEGLSTSGRLSAPAMDRAVGALQICADKLEGRVLRRARLIATEACRAAENGAEFLARVAAETGLALEVIDRQTEARLAVSGCGSLVERDTDGVVLFDIGGGSSEIALIDVSGRRSPRLANHIVSWTSLPVGVVSLAERFGGREVSREIFEAMVGHVTELLARFEGRNQLGSLASGRRFHLLGTSGTVTTLAGVHLGLERYDRRRVDGLWMDNGSIDAMLAMLLSWDFDQRVANACIGPDRADLVLAGCAILEAIRREWPSERLRVADRGLREGMLSELMADEGVWRREPPTQSWSARSSAPSKSPGP